MILYICIGEIIWALVVPEREWPLQQYKSPFNCHPKVKCGAQFIIFLKCRLYVFQHDLAAHMGGEHMENLELCSALALQ